MDLKPGKDFDKYIAPNGKYIFMMLFYLYHYVAYFILSSMTTQIPEWIESVIWIYFIVSPLIFIV